MKSEPLEDSFLELAEPVIWVCLQCGHQVRTTDNTTLHINLYIIDPALILLLLAKLAENMKINAKLD